jgi:uncharacterized protein (TIGR03437 family)
VAGGGSGGDGGLATGASLNPVGVALDTAGNLLIAEYWNQRVRKVAPSGIISTVAGDLGYRAGGDGGPAVEAQLNYPAAIAADSAGNLFIADSANNRIRKISAGGTITTVAGNGLRGDTGNGGLALSATLFSPQGVAVDGEGNLFIADIYGIRKVAPSGVITTVLGDGSNVYFFQGIAVDSSDNVFAADSSNNVVFKVTPDGVMTKVAGNGAQGYTRDGGPAAEASLNTPSSVAVDSAVNLFITDTENYRIRKVNAAGIISTVAGVRYQNLPPLDFGDGGPATEAGLLGAYGLTLDGSGNLFFAEASDNRIRMVNTAGIISTVAGNGTAGFSGDGGLSTNASLNPAYGVAVDPAGNLFIADTNNNRIREVPAVAASFATTVSAASGTAPVAPGSIVTIYGSNLAASAVGTNLLPLPTNLGGTSVTITDSTGTQASLPLFYAGPNHIDAEIPQTLSGGTAILSISTPTGSLTSDVLLNTVAPGLFAANQDGSGVAAAQLVTNQPDGSQTVVNIFNSPCAAGTCVGVPLDVSSGQTALVLFGTGIRNLASLSAVMVTIGSQTLPAAYAGPAPTYTGLDQVNVLLPASLAGSGTVDITVSISSSQSNVVTAAFK